MQVKDYEPPPMPEGYVPERREGPTLSFAWYDILLAAAGTLLLGNFLLQGTFHILHYSSETVGLFCLWGILAWRNGRPLHTGHFLVGGVLLYFLYYLATQDLYGHYGILSTEGFPSMLTVAYFLRRILPWLAVLGLGTVMKALKPMPARSYLLMALGYLLVSLALDYCNLRAKAEGLDLSWVLLGLDHLGFFACVLPFLKVSGTVEDLPFVRSKK